MKHLLKRGAIFTLIVMGAGSAFADPARIVAFGASQTEGKIVPRDKAYPAQLEALLRSQGMDVLIANHGESGDTTTDLRRRLERSIPTSTQIVLFQPGTNDCGRRHGTSESTFRQNMQAILGWLKERHMAVLVLGGGCYEALQAQLPREYGYAYYGRMTQGLDQYARPDGQHYVADGYARMAELLAPHVKALIEGLK
jgi:acyl-CoA thioesterase I